MSTTLTSALPGALGAVLILGASLWLWVRTPTAGFLPLSVFILLAPTSSFIPNLFQPAAESRMYIPLAAVVTLAVLGGWRALERFSPSPIRLFSAGASVLGIGLMSLTIARNHTYANTVELWRQTAEAVPENPRAHNSLGTALSAVGDKAGAQQAFEAAVHADPSYAPAQFNLGVSLLNAGKAQEALPHLQASLAVPEGKAEANLYLGQALVQLGRLAEAVSPLGEALRLNPHSSDAAFELGNALGALGRYPEAASALAQAAAIEPNEPTIRNNYANALLYSGSVDQAVAQYRIAATLAPSDAAIRDNLDQALRVQASRNR